MRSPLRPFVSDRYLMKAIFKLTDDEIDAARANEPDPLEGKGVNLSERRPPAIADEVYSLSTGKGPFTLIDHVSKSLSDEDGASHTVVCGLLRNAAGKLVVVPLADLVLASPDRELRRPSKGSWVMLTLAMILSLAIGSGIALGYFWP